MAADFIYMLRACCCGRGSYGKVWIVQQKNFQGTLYALKYISKALCSELNAVKSIIAERNILAKIKHPFVVNLRYAFHDDENMYLVLDLCMGGDLRYHLYRRVGGFHERVLRLWAVEVALAIHYLHGQGIVHRDVKPENILLDSDGHVHLADFNVAGLLEDNHLSGKAGTPLYTAPEIITSPTYGSQCDWWSLGATLYHLYFGCVPFGGEEIVDVYASILHNRLEFPEQNTLNFRKLNPSEEFLSFLKLLLEKDPNRRMGFDGIKSHPWLKGFDFDSVLKKQVSSAFVPDPSNYDFQDFHSTLGEKENKPAKLTPVHRPPRTKLEEDLAYIEDNFLIYDPESRTRISRYSHNQVYNASLASSSVTTQVVSTSSVSRPSSVLTRSSTSTATGLQSKDSSGQTITFSDSHAMMKFGSTNMSNVYHETVYGDVESNITLDVSSLIDKRGAERRNGAPLSDLDFDRLAVG